MRRSYQIVLGLMVMLLLFPSLSKAQNTTLDDNDNLRYRMYVNLNGGLTQSYCDIQNSTVPWGMLGKDQYGVAYGGKLGMHLSPVFTVFLQGKSGGLKGISGVDTKKLRFETKIHYDFGLGTTVNLSNLIFGYKPRTVSVYMPLSFGYTSFTPDVSLESNPNNLTDAQITAGLVSRYGTDLKETKTGEMYIANGLGVTFRINDRWSANAETNISWLQVDNFDGLRSGQGSGAGSNAADKLYDSWKDAYYYQNVGVSYNFLKPSNAASFKIETGYEPLALVGDSVPVVIEGEIPENFNSKAVVDFTPIMKYGDKTIQLKTIYLQGEEVADEYKKAGAIVLPETGGKFTYTTMVPYQAGMEQAIVSVDPMASIKGKSPKSIGDRPTNDGLILTSKRLRHDEQFFGVDIVLDRTRKMESQKETVWFVVDRTNKNMSYKLNRRSEAKDQINLFNDFLAKKLEFKNITISAWASPEGEETHNVGLSENRVATGKAFLMKQFKKLKIETDGLNIAEKPLAEDWNGFVAAMKVSSISDKSKIINIVNNQPDLAAREQEIKNMAVVYKEIADEILPELRRVEIEATAYSAEKFLTDAELKDKAMNSPADLSTNELLYVANKLINSDEAKLKVYKTILASTPKCWRAANNAAFISAKLGNYADASSYAKTASNLKPSNPMVVNNAAAIALKSGDKSSRSKFLEAQQGGASVNHNLGIIKIMEGNFNGAVTSFSGDNCAYNKGLAQLLAKNYSAAKSTLDCADKAADTYYLKAILGARTNDLVYLTSNLKEAIKLNKDYINDAKNDTEFRAFVTNPEFLNAIK